LRLPADHRSPAAARAAVRSVLTEAGLTSLLDEALLLTTELSTNGVIHAGTELDVEILADDAGVTVTVTDFRGGPLEAAMSPVTGDLVGALPATTGSGGGRGLRLDPPEQYAERGRGLLLVDQFASSWGTTHHPAGKGVWFRLDLSPDKSPPDRDGAAGPPATGRVPSAEAVSWLLGVPEEVRANLDLEQLVSELLLRLCEVVGATGGTVRLDRGDGAGETTLASYGTPDPPLPLVIPLAVGGPLRGRLSLAGGTDPATTALSRLTAERIAVAIEADRLREDDHRRRGWVRYLAEVGELLAQSLDTDLTIALVPQLVVPRLGRWCAVHVTDGYGMPKLAACTHIDETCLPVLKRLLGGPGGAAGVSGGAAAAMPGLPGAPPPSNVDLGRVPYEREPGAADDGGVILRLDELARGEASAVTLGRPAEGVAVPLTARGQVLGTLSVGRPVDRLHGPDDVAVIEDVARRAALAIDNARIHAERKRIAQAFQAALLPSALPVATGVRFGAEYVPASTGTDVGGDFYDVLELTPDRWLVSIGDVCGKGAQAAAITGLVRDVLRVMVLDGRPLARAIELLNRTMVEQHDDGRFCTIAAALVSRAPDGYLDAELCLAGHDSPVLLRPDCSTEFVGGGGTAVGLLDVMRLDTTTIRLAPGDTLVFYTDGVTERRRGTGTVTPDHLYGHERLRTELSALAGRPPAALAARLRAAVLAFSPEPPRDDIAILAVSNA